MEMLLMNPRRRRRKAKARRAGSRRRRKMSALQLKYFGKRRRSGSSSRRRARRHSSARRGKRSIVIMNANPSRRRSRRRSSVRSLRRRYRRNPISSGALRLSLASVLDVAKRAAVGGAGAVLTDIAYAQALSLAPDNVKAAIGSRYSDTGGANFMYYGAKLGLAVAIGVAGAKFLPGSLKRHAAQATEGALTVGAYEIIRLMMPASVALAAYTARPSMGRLGRLGYMNPAAVAANPAERTLNARNLSAYTGARRLSGMRGMRGMRGVNASGSMTPTYYSGDTRVGEGAML